MCGGEVVVEITHALFVEFELFSRDRSDINVNSLVCLVYQLVKQARQTHGS